MPVRDRKPNEIAQQVMPLLLLGVALIESNRSFTVIDDEVNILGPAVYPVRTTLAQFWSGQGQHHHPPLYDIILHFWLRLTGGEFEYLRVPAVLFFLVGIFLLARVARRLGGASSAVSLVWLSALWPFGFHYGRLAVWYSFSFFLVAGVTLAYLRYLDDQNPGRWAALFVFCVCLVWTNYFGWAILGCLAIDQFLRFRAAEPTAKLKVLLGTAALLGLSFAPLFPVLRNEVHTGMHLNQGAVKVLANAAFNVYSFFVSESVAPWNWFLSVPAGLAVLLAIGLVFICAPRPVRRFQLYGALLIATMAVTGILNTRRLLLIAPWVLLPIGIAVGTNKPKWARMALAIALLVFTGIGWYGIYSKRYYSAPRFIEPWQQIAGDAADKIQKGATVVANSPSFFFYLTYVLRAPDQLTPWKFAGVLPDQIHHPQVHSPEEWLASGHKIEPKMIWIRGMSGPQIEGPMDDAARELDRACGDRVSRRMMRDPGFEWKQKYFPNLGELQWRIEIHEYDCMSPGSPEIFQIPAR